MVIKTSLCSGQHPEEARDPLPAMAAPTQPPPGMSRTFYKRDLPCPPAVAFSSDEGQQIFRDALASGTLQGFFKLIEQFRTQDEPAYCGLASVAMVLNTLAIDPRRTWKGPWRFFHEQMLDCCLPLEKVRQEGITLQQASCLARCNGAAVTVYPHGSASVEQLREMVIDACSTGDRHLVVSYTRKAFLQTGDGHFSPIGGYSPNRDMVLILDTARFKYPPHWVALEELYDAMAALDPTTGKPRGFMQIGLQPLLESVLFTLDLRDPRWEAAFRYASTGIAAAAEAAAVVPGASAEAVLAAAGLAAPSDAVSKFLAVRTAGNSCDSGVCTQMAAVETFLHELRGMPLYKALDAATRDLTAAAERGAAEDTTPPADSAHGADGPGDGRKIVTGQPAVPGPLIPERLAMLMLLVPPETWDRVQPAALRGEISALLDLAAFKVVGHEVQYLKEQYKELPAMKQALDASFSSAKCASAGCVPSEQHRCGGAEAAAEATGAMAHA